MRHSGFKQFRSAAPASADDLRALGLVPGAGAEDGTQPATGRAARRTPWQRLRAMLTFTPHMFWSYDVDTREDHYSRQWLAFTGARNIDRPGGVGRIELV